MSSYDGLQWQIWKCELGWFLLGQSQLYNHTLATTHVYILLHYYNNLILSKIKSKIKK